MAQPLLALALSILLGGCDWFGPTDLRARLERQWQDQGHVLVLVPFGVPQDAAARTLRFDRQSLKTHRLYLRSRQDARDFIYIAAHGAVQRRERQLATMADHGELVLAEGNATLFVDGTRITEPGKDWEILWETDKERPPPLESLLHPKVAVVDGFMRFDLASPPCEEVTGTMQLSQHGGGLPRDEAEVESYDFQRAVNPFTVRGSNGGTLRYGDATWAEYLGEARFYFGVPRTEHVIDVNTVPVDTEMLVVQGSPGGHQVGFGWVGGQERFCLVERDGDADWSILAIDDGPRPSLTNWVRIGIAVRDGCRVEGWLDQRHVLSAVLDQRVQGDFLIAVGDGLVELDDIRVRSLPLPPDPPQPLLAKSRAFAGKKHKGNADPQQFGQWAEASDTFVRFLDRGDSGVAVGIRTRQPLIGPWEYQSQAYDERLGEIPTGTYQFVVSEPDMDRPTPGSGKEIGRIEAIRGDKAWTVSLANREPLGPLFPLHFRRAETGAIVLRNGEDWVDTGLSAPGSVRLGIVRERPENGILVSPQPEHHRILLANLRNEFFEEAPVDWSWVDGSFRMDARWACQNQWNFLACGSPAVPMIVSKRSFSGEQLHECFMSQRPVMPWDAGDASFSYNPDADRENKFQILIANEGWYVRRDLNLSFCCDGRNPLSGYAVVFGADDNTETRLVRQGLTVARTSDPALLFPKGGGFGAVHYLWRRISIWKKGARIRVSINGQSVFDFTDPAPLDGGHVAFWSVRSGFAVTRATSSADTVSYRPDVLYVPPVKESGSGWRALHTDALRASAAEAGMTRFTRTSGTGFGAARHELSPDLPISPSTTLTLPLELGEGTSLNLHVQTSEGSFLVPVRAPIEGMKALLTPEFEKGECFRLPTFDGETVRRRFLIDECTYDGHLLRCELGKGIQRLTNKAEGAKILSLTLGNSSNTDYLLAGARGNQAGTWFAVGQPTIQCEGSQP